MIARELDAPAGEFRAYVRALVQERLRERGDAWEKLDDTLVERERRKGR
jgi:hypothetical protein